MLLSGFNFDDYYATANEHLIYSSAFAAAYPNKHTHKCGREKTKIKCVFTVDSNSNEQDRSKEEKLTNCVTDKNSMFLFARRQKQVRRLMKYTRCVQNKNWKRKKWCVHLCLGLRALVLSTAQTRLNECSFFFHFSSFSSITRTLCAPLRSFGSGFNGKND